LSAAAGGRDRAHPRDGHRRRRARERSPPERRGAAAPAGAGHAGGLRRPAAPVAQRADQRRPAGDVHTPVVTFDLLIWMVARVAGLTAFAALSISLLSGLSLRTGVLDWLGSNRVLRSLHEYTTVLWMPLGALHIIALLLDRTARIGPLDLVVPFLVP